MLEVWIQWTCDDCGRTDEYFGPDTKKSDVNDHLKSKGVMIKGKNHYCPQCRKRTLAKSGASNFLSVR